MPGEHRAVVAHALAVYRGQSDDERFDEGALEQFATWVTEEIGTTQSK